MIEWEHIGPQILVVDIILFNVIGNFGNFNLVWTTLRRKEMRSKAGCLLAINAVYQSICLFSLLVNAVVIVRGTPILQRDCYPMITLFMFACSQQPTMAFFIALDLLIALVSPVRYHFFETLPYLIIVNIPGSIFALFFTVYGWLTMNDDKLQFCNVFIALPPNVSSAWTLCNVVINFAVLIVYMAIFLVLKFRLNPAAYKEHRRVIRRLTVIVIVFVCSWFMALLGGYFLIMIGISRDILPYLQINLTTRTTSAQLHPPRCEVHIFSEEPTKLSNSAVAKLAPPWQEKNTDAKYRSAHANHYVDECIQVSP